MGRRPRPSKAEDPSKAEEPTQTPVEKEHKPPESPAKKEAETSKGAQPKGPPEHAEEFYRAAAVVFFSRTAEGAVAKVLTAVEERKVQASYIGLPQQGKVIQRLLLFPMGRREKKDKGDTVETAKREYIEETGDYGGLAKYLDFADFSDGAGEPASELPRTAETWSGLHNTAVYFAPANMIVLLCEVPAEATLANHRAAAKGIPLEELAAKEKAEVAAAAQVEQATGADGPARKKPKKEKQKPQERDPSFTVGKTDQLEPAWIEAEDLRTAITSDDRSPVIRVRGEDCRLFPTVASILRLPDVRQWLGMAVPG